MSFGQTKARSYRSLCWTLPLSNIVKTRLGVSLGGKKFWLSLRLTNEEEIEGLGEPVKS
jgi:hypothetical protein